MPMQIIRNDIVKVQADAIVNSANRRPSFGTGVDQRIYQAAGVEKLLVERLKIGELSCGEAAVTSAFNLPAKYIFHVNAPRWKGGEHNEIALLRSCYDKVLALAVEHNCKSIAIPLLATGNFRFPRGLGLEIATDAIRDFLAEHELNIILVVYDRRSFTLSKELEDDVKAYIDDNYIGEHPSKLHKRRFNHYEEREAYVSLESDEIVCAPKFSGAATYQILANPWDAFDPSTNNFSSYLTQLLNRKGFDSNKEICRSCGFDSKLLSKILNPEHHPSKKTVMQLCIGLKLNLDEATDLMKQAGYAFNPNNKTELIVKYCIEKHMDMFTTDEIVYKYTDQTLSNCC